ncbi:MAG: formate dehydrogenase accessory sulfurtransferase FdhD [Puniceicoccaceae bacterium]
MVTQGQAVQVKEGIRRDVEDSLVVEEPLQIRINGRPFSITMRTPGADADLVRGLLYAEGIVDLQGLGQEVVLTRKEGYMDASIEVPEIFLCQDRMEKRSLIANAACGFCGKTEIADLRLQQPRLQPRQPLAAGIIPGLGQEMRSRQTGFEATGGCHAAAAFSIEGKFLALYEDIGRHNAVDKVIGHLIGEGLLDVASVLQVSGRISFEIVSKAAAAGIPFLCAVSAPSSLAVQWAHEAGITLLAFCRENRFTVYANKENIDFGETVNGQ